MRTLGLLVALTISLSACDEEQPQPEIGRYRIQSSGQGTVMLDTATGKTWMQVYAANRRDEAAYWEPSARQDDRGEWQAYEALHPLVQSNSN